MQESHSSFFRKRIIHITILALLAVVVYSNSFQVPFVFDDDTSIVENHIIQSLPDFLSNGYAFNSHRFIGYLSLTLNYHFGGLNVTGYHLFNLAVHIGNALLVYCLVRLTFRTPFLNRSSLATRSDGLALAVALLFVAHPVQTQAVTYIVQRLASLVTLFYLGALVLHVRWRLDRESGEPFLSGRVLPAFLLSLVSAILAMKTKEIAFTLPLIVLLYEYSFFGRPDLRRLGSLFPMLLTILIIPLNMISINKPIGELLSDADRATSAASTLPRWDYLCIQFSVIVTYLRLLFLPVGQNLDYDYPVSHSLFEPRTFLSLLLLLSLFAGALFLWRRSGGGWDNGLRIASFGILWFFITLSVESSIIPIADVIFEHRLYLPSIGFFIALVALCAMVAERSRLLARLQLPLLAVAVLLFGGAAYARNNVWQDGISLWEDTAAKSPKKARPINALGVFLIRKGDLDAAVLAFQKALRLNHEYSAAHNNLGITLNEKSSLDAVIHNNLGYVFAKKGNLDAAIKEYDESLSINPGYSLAHNNLGNALAYKGNVDGAIEEFREALRIDPSYSVAHNNLGLALVIKGRVDAAIQEYHKALQLNPNYSEAHNNLGVALANKGDLDRAVQEFCEALRIDPDYSDAHNNLGIVLARKGELDAAIREYREALRLTPNFPEAISNLERALDQKRKRAEPGR